MKSLFCLILAFNFYALGLAQGVLISDTPGQPNPDAMLEVRSTNGGLLLPRLTQTQRDAIVNPTAGLTIYNLSSSCVDTYFPGGWRAVKCNCQSYPNPSFTISPSPASINSTVSFAATSGAQNYQWTFQGGTPATGSGQNATANYAQAGTYQVHLVVTDAQGCSDSSSQSLVVSACPPSGSQTFSFTGAAQSFVVPACVTSIQITARGAQGANGVGQDFGVGGPGGTSIGDLSVTPGETLHVYVGGQNGWNGGGNGTSNSGNGGGASDVRQGGQSLNDRVIVAGGGGGGGGDTYNDVNSYGGDGGHGGGQGTAGGANSGSCCGGTPGNAAWSLGGGRPGQSHNCWTTPGFCGGGGSAGGNSGGGQPATGATNPGTAGTFGQGGNGGNHSSYGDGGGGGGGWYGGAGGSSEGNGGGGGGGSAYIGGVSNGQVSPGNRQGNGEVIISW